jgi:hypothetical protein
VKIVGRNLLRYLFHCSHRHGFHTFLREILIRWAKYNPESCGSQTN